MSNVRSWHIALAALAAFTPWIARDAGAQEPKEAAKAWLQDRLAEFQEYRLVREAARKELVMESRSLLNWSNAERGTDQGGVFLWTDRGLPQMIACAFEWGGSLKHEFHSLSTEPIVAERKENAVHRFGPGIEWSDLEGAPKPAEVRTIRLAQMRRQAERFHVSVGHEDRAETRLLPQPVYRSPAEAEEDVAVFVFVQGTDPECVLLLEVTPDAKWHYALARQTKWALKAEHDGRPIWEAAPKHRPELDRDTPFLVLPQPKIGVEHSAGPRGINP